MSSLKAENNIYTVLVLVAFLALATGVGIVWSLNVSLTAGERPSSGFANPFFVIDR